MGRVSITVVPTLPATDRAPESLSELEGRVVQAFLAERSLILHYRDGRYAEVRIPDDDASLVVDVG